MADSDVVGTDSGTPQYDPPPELAATANVTAEAYADAADDRLDFWERQAAQLRWARPWDEVLDWSDPPFAKWFVGGRINVAVNCLDRHVEAGHGDRVAIHWEGEPGDTRTITYAELLADVSRAANALTELGVDAGDRVAIYLPMVPEAVVTMLACARIGAVHAVIFGGYSADAIATRVEDIGARVVVTADGGYRRGSPTRLKPTVDEALADTSTVEHVLVVRRNGEDVTFRPGRDLWWHDVLAAQPDTHVAEAFDSEHPLFVLHTSGTTGTPKGILHTAGGYLTHVAYTQRAVFDTKPDSDVFWCTADVGWVTGHSYIVYGPLAVGATQVMYEGTPDTPHQGRIWEIVDKYGVTVLYTAPTLIRTFMKWGDELPQRYDLGSLRLLGSVGEPINPEAWRWYREVVGRNRCPIVDTWWQTETGGIVISPLPGVTRTKPGSATRPLPGMSVDVVDESGASVPTGSDGLLVLTEPWPGMLRGIWGNPERFRSAYWSQLGPEVYVAGDGARRDADGDIWVLGRVDDLMNVSGHRLSTSEVENALVEHPAVAEAAVVGASDETTGQAIVAFVILLESATEEPNVAQALRDHVARHISPIAKPRQVIVVEELPKTRSGKIMRRLLRDVAEQRELGDVTTLADPTVMGLIRSGLDREQAQDSD